MAESESERIRHANEARAIWLGGLTYVVYWAEQSVATRTDDSLAWYTKPPEGETVPMHGLSAERISAVIEQLERVRDITMAGVEGPPPSELRRMIDLQVIEFPKRPKPAKR